MSTPLVSVIVPAHDAEPWLEQAVRSALAQRWRALEVIVVDDGSRDGTGALADRLAAASPRVRALHQPNRGVSAARNAGLAAARGELLCFLDADDALLPDKLTRQAAYLARHPACDLVWSDHWLGDDRLRPQRLLDKAPPLPIGEILTFRNWFSPFSPLLRAGLAARVGGFDEALRGSEDWDFWIRASACGRLEYLPGAVGIYRRHPAQATKDWLGMRANQDRVVRKNRARGSEAWGNSRAMLSLATARRCWAHRRYGLLLSNLAAFAWHARSARRRRLLAVVTPDRRAAPVEPGTLGSREAESPQGGFP